MAFLTFFFHFQGWFVYPLEFYSVHFSPKALFIINLLTWIKMALIIHAFMFKSYNIFNHIVNIICNALYFFQWSHVKCWRAGFRVLGFPSFFSLSSLPFLKTILTIYIQTSTSFVQWTLTFWLGSLCYFYSNCSGILVFLASMLSHS